MQAPVRMVESVWFQVISHSANACLDFLEDFAKEVCKLMVKGQVVSTMFFTNLMLLQLRNFSLQPNPDFLVQL